MKYKNPKIKDLQQNLIKFSKQTGLLECELDTLAFYNEEYRAGTAESTERYGINNKPTRNVKSRITDIPKIGYRTIGHNDNTVHSH